ncbi:MAG: efflux RND transporter periplasmic adaptor subunit [Deltaproteobacteria bacterium]|nr:efflux RND transporter periplasmic adaptor subunit [Deltaproteobacteria bacterium]
MREAFLVLGLVYASCGKAEGDAAIPKPSEKKQERPALVEVAEVRRGAMADTWRFIGDVRPVHRAVFSAGASGAITRVLVDVGDRVQKGRLMVEIDPATSEAAAEGARASVARGNEVLAQARREADRLAGLDDHTVPAIELERAKSRVKQLEAEQGALAATLAAALAELQLHKVTAAFEGVVSKRAAQLGAWVRPGDPVVELVSADRLEVFVDASKDLARRIELGQIVKLAHPGSGELEVAGIVPALDPATRTALVRLTPSEKTRLVPGDVVSVEFAIDLSGDGFVVPEDALVVSPSESRVVRVAGTNAEHLRVQVLARASDRVLVFAEGLREGDRVVTRGNERLRPGQLIEVSGVR